MDMRTCVLLTPQFLLSKSGYRKIRDYKRGIYERGESPYKFIKIQHQSWVKNVNLRNENRKDGNVKAI
jgi:hypothetical protein